MFAPSSIADQSPPASGSRHRRREGAQLNQRSLPTEGSLGGALHGCQQGEIYCRMPPRGSSRSPRAHLPDAVGQRGAPLAAAPWGCSQPLISPQWDRIAGRASLPRYSAHLPLAACTASFITRPASWPRPAVSACCCLGDQLLASSHGGGARRAGGVQPVVCSSRPGQVRDEGAGCRRSRCCSCQQTLRCLAAGELVDSSIRQRGQYQRD